ncbi:MAG TPA: CaiB/BaiF CoA-transferase family protein [Caulobacteraceae bacterium]
MAAAPMDGLRVIDFSTTVAGPWATRLMADCGAEVIKVEAAGEGDVLRHAPPIAGAMSRVFAQFNCGKKSVALNLKSADGLAAARALMDGADVVVENFRPGVMDRLGLGYSDATAGNPRLVYCSVSGFGQDGPLAGSAAYAPVVHAMTGFDAAMMAAQGAAPGDPPPAAGVMIADVVAASYAFGAVQAALLRRERFGCGAHVDVSLIEAMMSLVGIQYQEAQAPQPPRSTVFRPVCTLDGHMIVPLVTPRNYQGLFSVIGRPAWADDALIASPGALSRRRRDIEDALGDWTRTRTSAECVEALTAAGVACGAHAAPKDVLSHPHMAARGSFAELEDADGAFKVLNPPFRMTDAPCRARAGVARLGEHTDEILGALALPAGS